MRTSTSRLRASCRRRARARVTFAQAGRGGSQWLTALADAQRTSWIRTDDKISVRALSKPGFELQWKTKLDNQPRGAERARRRASRPAASRCSCRCRSSRAARTTSTASTTTSATWCGSGSSTSRCRRRRRRAPAASPPPPRASSGLTRRRPPRRQSVRRRARRASDIAACSASRAKACRSRDGPAVRAAATAPAPPACGAGGTPPASSRRGSRRGTGSAATAGGPRRAGRSSASLAHRATEEGGAAVRLPLPSVGRRLRRLERRHAARLGLPSGKDIQKPAPFLPANAKWSAPIAVDTMLYAATSGDCGGAPNGVWAIDLDSDAKPVMSWKTNGGDVVGAVAFTSDGTLIAAIGPGQATGDGKANAIVALDPKNAAAEGLVHAARRGVRDRADDPPSRRQGHRRGGDEGRPRAAARRGVARRRAITRRRSHASKPCWRRRDRQRGCARGVAAVRSDVVDSVAGRAARLPPACRRPTAPSSTAPCVALKLSDAAARCRSSRAGCRTT